MPKAHVTALTNDDVVNSLASMGIDHRRVGECVIAHTDNFAWIPASSVAAVVTDPPFNIARKSNFHSWEHNTIHNFQLDGDKGWDTHSRDAFITEMREWAASFERVLLRGGTFAIFCADAYLSHLIEALKDAGLAPKRTFTWRKPNAVPVNRGVLPMSACEYIVWGTKPRAKATFNANVGFGASERATIGMDAAREIEAFIVADKAASIVNRAVRDAMRRAPISNAERPISTAEVASVAIEGALAEVKKKVAAMYSSDTELRACVPNYVEHPSATGTSRIHPTEKPVGILRYLIALSTRPGDIVLDPFGGSGSTGEAALQIGRRPIIVERDAEYFALAAARLERLGTLL